MNWGIIVVGAFVALAAFVFIRDLDRAANGIRVLPFTLPNGDVLYGDFVGVPYIGGTVIFNGQRYTVTAVTWTAGTGRVAITLEDEVAK